MATVALFLNHVATLAEGCADLLRDAQIFSLNSHSIKPDRMAALPELFQLLGMALPAFFREDPRLLLGGCLMVDVAGHAMDAFFGMLRIYPGLEKPGCPLLVAGHAKSGVHLDRLFSELTRTRYSREH
jgi:hypothetical protein